MNLLDIIVQSSNKILCLPKLLETFDLKKKAEIQTTVLGETQFPFI